MRREHSCCILCVWMGRHMSSPLCERRIWHRDECVRCRNLVERWRSKHCAITRTGWTLVQVYYIVTFHAKNTRRFHCYLNVKPLTGPDSIHYTFAYSLFWFRNNSYMDVAMTFWSDTLAPHVACVAGHVKLIGGYDSLSPDV
jgi:hypothetical protein